MVTLDASRYHSHTRFKARDDVTAATPSTPLTSANAAPLFPVLSTAQISRIASHGVIRPTTRGEVLIQGGQTNVPFFVVKAGEIEVIDSINACF